VWRDVLVEHFSTSKTSVQKQSKKTVVKITFDTEHEQNVTVKVNLFDTGSVNIQGLKCSTFTDHFFEYLEAECNSHCEKTSPKKLLYRSKSSDDLHISPNAKAETPVSKSHAPATPGVKEKATVLSKSIESKFVDIHNALSTMDEICKSQVKFRSL
jgi:hypothetical protein